MTKYLIASYLFFSIHYSNNVDSEQINLRTEKNISEDLQETEQVYKKYDMNILLGCGVIGEVSKQIFLVNDLVKNKDYKILIKNLASDDLLTQLLSVIALEQLNKIGLIEISSKERELISKIKSSDKTFSACEGCTEHYSGTIADIFSNKHSFDILKTLKFEIGLGDD